MCIFAVNVLSLRINSFYNYLAFVYTSRIYSRNYLRSTCTRLQLVELRGTELSVWLLKISRVTL